VRHAAGWRWDLSARDFWQVHPARLVHLACDPAVLARDIAGYLDAGYRLVALHALDAFPMTHHVECMAALAR
jgi:tRNA/tmRNA/rRNA uracil-C5-methylase (TrmA/RlmC/RlmD family)